MRKFLAVVSREYRKVVFKWTFLITTLLMPLLASLFVFVPMLIFSIEGEATRIAIVDKEGTIEKRLKENLSPKKLAERAREAAKDSLKDLNPSQEEQLRRSSKQIGGNFSFVDYDSGDKSLDSIKDELRGLVADKKIEAFLIVPEDISATDVKFEFFTRKAGDFIVNSSIEDAINTSVRAQRLSDSDISEEKLKLINSKVNFSSVQLTEDENPRVRRVARLRLSLSRCLFTSFLRYMVKQSWERLSRRKRRVSLRSYFRRHARSN